MQAIAVECVLKRGKEQFRAVTADDFASLDSRETRLFLVPASRADSLIRTVPGAINLGKKHGSRAPWQYFIKLRPGESGIVIGEYKSARQLGPSARVTLEKLKRRAVRCVLQVPDACFDQLRVVSDDEGTGRRAAENSVYSFLLQTQRGLDTEEVPAELAEEYIGSAEAVKLVRQQIWKARTHSQPVLILGESGTGKEIVARKVHYYRYKNGKCSQTIHAVNCSAIPDALIESELFGHKRGAFTGATQSRVGRWKTVGRGTLFLDEIGELPQESQAKILRAIEANEIQPVGEDKKQEVEARVIAATNRDLYTMVQHGTFRGDLYFRLAEFSIVTPALREHPEDIPLIAQWLWTRITGQSTRPLPESVTDYLAEFNWPGNVRELKSVISALNIWFGNHVKGRAEAELVMYFVGQPKEIAFRNQSDIPKGVRNAAALKQTQRAIEALATTRHCVEQFEKCSSPQTAAHLALPQAIEDRHRELMDLCRDPRRFGSGEAYKAVHAIAGKIGLLLQAIQSGQIGPGATPPDPNLSREVARTKELLERHFKKLLSSAQS